MVLRADSTFKPRSFFLIKERLKLSLTRAVALPQVRHWLLRCPLTRWLARIESQKLFDVCAGFVYSQVLFAFIETPLLRELSRGPAFAEDLASAADLPLDRMERLLQATCAIGLTDTLHNNMYCLGLRGAALIENPGVIGMIKHHALLYEDLADPVSLLRDPNLPTQTANFWTYLGVDREIKMSAKNTIEYSQLMAASQTMISEIICASVDFSQYRKILDVGGGLGIFAKHVADSAPRTNVTVFDLPQVVEAIEHARETKEKITRIEAIGGDFFKDTVPTDYDLITLVRVLYDHSDENVDQLLRNIHESLKPNGTLLIAEPFASPGAADRTADAYFNMYLLAMRAGNVRSFCRHAELLRAAGFRKIQIVQSINPSLARIILARA